MREKWSGDVSMTFSVAAGDFSLPLVSTIYAAAASAATLNTYRFPLGYARQPRQNARISSRCNSYISGKFRVSPNYEC